VRGNVVEASPYSLYGYLFFHMQCKGISFW
jgi:hypothetical protein